MANTLYDYYTGQGQKLPSIAERSKIYETSGLGSASLYTGTAEQNTALLNNLKNTSVKYEELGKAPTPDVPAPNPANPAGSFMGGLAGANVQNQAQLTEQQQRLLESQKLMKDAQMLQGVNPDQTAYDQRMTQLEEAYKGTMGKGEAYKQQLEQSGVPEAQKQLADLNILMAQQQASFNQGMLDTEGKVIPMRFITGQQAQMQKQYAITAGNTAMMAQALQGNITMAKQTAMDTVNLEYADREAELEMQKQMLELNYDKLTKSEQKRADELNFMLDQETKRLEEEKATKKDINSLLIETIKRNAPTSVQNAVKNAKTVEEAAMAASGYLSDADSGVKFTKIGSETDKFGNTKDIFGFVDESTQKVYDLGGNDVTSSDNTSVSPTEGSISYRTNNPGNIKWTGADWQIALGATNSGIKATDGGTFAQFPSLEAGTNAQKQLLTGSSYANRTLDEAMKRWSNNGYGAEVAPTIPKNTLMKDLRPDQLDTLMEKMKEREGFFAPTKKQESDVNDNISNITGKPLTEAERASRTYATRLQESSKIIDSLDEKFTGRFSGLPSAKIFGIGIVPEALKSEDRKSLEQAQRNFVNALLRKESGAAISESEFESASKQYFPQPGDTEDILKQKAQNRKTVIEGMMLSGGMVATEDTSLTDEEAYNAYLNLIK